MKKRYFPFIIIFALFLSGQAVHAQVDYNSQIQPIFNASCTVCHNAGFAQANVDLSSYTAVLNSIGGTCGGSVIIPGNANGSNLISKVDPAILVCGGGPMPQGGPVMAAADINLIRNWIDQGAAPADPTTGTYYTNFIAPALLGTCTNCHNSGFAQANVRLDTKANILSSIGNGCGKTVINGSASTSPLITKIDPSIPVCSGTAMPPPSGGALSNAQVNAIAQWINGMITLPVEIVSFEAAYNGASNLVNLNWEVTEDPQLDFFTVERAGETLEFIPIARIKANEEKENAQHYNWTDQDPLVGKIYYRLVQTDLNGALSNSPMREVFVSIPSQTIHLFPNPASTQFSIEVFSSKDETIQVEVMSIMGQQVFHKSLLLHPGSNLSTVETTHWTPGIYLVRMFSNGILNKTVKLIVE